MPGLVAVAGHEGGGTDHVADSSLVNELTAGLDACAHVGIGCARDPESLFLGQSDQLHAFLPGCTQGLFGVDGLTRQESGLGDLEMLIGAGDVEHHVHLGVCKQLVHIVIELGNVVFLDGVLCPLADEVADADDFNVLEAVGDVLQVDARNGTNAYEADFCHGNLLRCFLW